MTLVITKGSTAVPVLWADLGVQSLEEAKDVLAAREGILPKNIDRDVGFCSGTTLSNHDQVQAIAAWASSKNIDAVVWTALPPGFKKARGRIPSSDEVIAYVRGLLGNARLLAEEYVRRAPEQVHTPYRADIERELKWERMPAGKTIARAMDIDEKAWGFDTIRCADGVRADRMEAVGPPDELVKHLVSGMNRAIDRNEVRLAVDAKDEGFSEQRAIVQFKVAPELYDWFFNGRTGYRAQFWSDPDAGISFNSRIIEGLANVLAERLPASISVRAIM